MGKLPFIALLITFIIALSASGASAQRRGQRTGGAKAAYGEPTENFSTRKKSKKKKKHSKKRKKTPNKNGSDLHRRDPWVN